MTTPAQPKHYPGEYRVSRGAGGEPFAIEGKTRTLALVKTCGDHTEANAYLFAAAPSLYAYTKAVELRHIAWSTKQNHAPYWEQLRSMGWQGSQHSADEFLSIYRATALALAEGGGK